MNQGNYFIVRASEIKKKWGPVIEHKYKINTDSIVEVLSLYTEWVYMREQNNLALVVNNVRGIGDNANIVTEALDNAYNTLVKLSPRQKIINQYYNPILSIFEYELENGEIIPASGIMKNNLSDDVLKSVFPIDFLGNIYPDLVRDIQIDNIIK
jgi:hypothetical protein